MNGKFCLIMVYCHISKDLKECALWLILHGYASEDICELFNISKRSVARWKQNDHLYGSVIPVTCGLRVMCITPYSWWMLYGLELLALIR
jgi:hypothetical protein